MSQSFAIRFAGILLAVLVLVAIGIQLFTTGETTVVMWIFTVPIILAVPVLASVILAKNEEMGMSSN
ncbi:hypothetical protein EC844_105136 [Acinetobacter calcoaceticus]|uniref:Uncharacterized protein n=1 Tax=Acinetobacter calcoaceticus TaxID=471 RepID=A0A4R1XYQ0_ACICA|nr:hypothetical protein EC844_105136 [Acinetobacter calcoaceticus]